MRRPVVLSLSAVALLGGCRPGVPALPDTNLERSAGEITAEVTGRLADLVEAMNAHDGDRVASFYDGGEDFTYIGNTDIQLGGQQHAAHVRQWARSRPDVTFAYEVADTRVLSPTVAVVVSRVTATDLEGLVWTQIFVREDDGVWRIALEHEAWPGAPAPPGPHPATEPDSPSDTGRDAPPHLG